MADLPDLMDPEVQACPYGLYARLRREAPVWRMPRTGFHLVTSHALCQQVIADPDLFASGVSPMALRPQGIPQGVIDVYTQDGWLPTASCSTSDPPRHTWVRGLLNRLFTAARVRAMTPAIEATAERLIDAFADDGACEFVKAFAHPLPMMIIAEQLGVADGDIAQFKAWSDAIVEPFAMMATPEREVECARLVVEMQHYFKDRIDQRRIAPTDDVLTILSQARDEQGALLPLDELLSIVTIDLLASGNETTTAAISSAMLLLIENPDICAELAANPDRIAIFAEEALRLESPAQGMFRRVTRPTVLGGVALAEGDLLSLRFGAANRDETVFPNADRVDLQRHAPGRHLAFGMGRHHCIGAPLARQELIISLTVLLRRLRDFRLQAPDRPLRYDPSFFGRNLTALPITFAQR